MPLEMSKYLKVRHAQVEGARTVEELKEMSDIVIETEEELQEVEALIKVACRSHKVSIETVVEAVKAGADTVEKVGEVTKAGTSCGRCKGIITNIIENKR